MKLKRVSQFVVLICLLGLIGFSTHTRSSAFEGTGEPPGGLQPQSVQAVNSISPFFTDTGLIGLSIDAVGTLESSAAIEAEKPTGATLRAAYLLAASRGFSGYQIADGDIWLAGLPVNWETYMSSSISSFNHLADVTWYIKPFYDLAPAGRVSFEVEEMQSYQIDGVALVVIYNDPSLTIPATVALLFGAQSVLGDSFEINFSEPIDINDPNLVLNMSLGISYGAQGCAPGQYSQIDVNGQRLTTSAGGEDDGTCNNGALITAGGLDDSIENPADPYGRDNGDPRQDDELYNLIPFVEDGTTSIKIDTNNPSIDDNIFLAAFELSSQALISTEPKRPVIFIPGFMGTKLNEGDEEIWPAPLRLINDGDEHLDALILTDEGLDPDGSNISIGDDIVRNVLLTDFYGGAVDLLGDLGYVEDENLFLFKYDFRKDIRITAKLLEDFINEKTGGSLRGVDIIAHSQGGLVTKQCILTDSCANLVNNAAILGTPFAGTPGGFRGLEYGQPLPDNWLGEWLGVSSAQSKKITQNWPNVYQLIPGSNYYDLYGQGFFIYDRDLNDDGENEGRLDYPAMKSFMSDRHNSDLVEAAEDFQRDGGVDTWLQGSNGVNVVVFVGTGLPTLTEIREYEWGIWPLIFVDHDFRQFETGDGTVTAISVALKNNQGVDYSGDNVHVFYVDKVKHTDLTKYQMVMQYIANIFANASSLVTRSELTGITTQAPADLPPPPEEILLDPTYVNGRQFLFNGDIQVSILDENGNLSGFNEDGEVELNAQGVTYTEIGGAKSLFVYGSGVYTITVKANKEGLFTLKARTVETSVEKRQVLFADVPLESEATQGRLRYDADQPSITDSIDLDLDGDGTFDTTVPPDSDITGEPLKDITAPKTSISVQGELVNERYFGEALVTLTAQDLPDGSGVAKIMYSLDEGKTFLEYTSPLSFTMPGLTTVYAFAIDGAGNIERDPASESVEILYNSFLPAVMH